MSVPEQGFLYDREFNELGGQLVQLCTPRHWQHYTEPPTPAIIPVVREFDSNLRADLGKSIVTMEVDYQPNAIGSLFAPPRLQQNVYQDILMAVDHVTVSDYLLPTGTQWK